MGNILDSPITEKDSHFYKGPTTGLSAGTTGMQGWRLEMEDAHVSEEIPDAPGHMFVAVFDGHAGSGSAIYAAREIIKVLTATDEWEEYKSGGFSKIDVLGRAMSKTFTTIDLAIRSHQENSNGTDNSGCTSVTAVITPTHILCANAGDSRCVLGSDGKTIEMSADHKPYGEIERDRIEKAGGFVQWNRVDGDLAVSRAFGDFSYKNAASEAKDQKVSPVPDIRVHVRDNAADDVLILACDGLWDVMSSEEAVNTVREIFEDGETDPVLVAEEMVDLALNKGSKDNISAVIVPLPAAKFGPASKGGVKRRREVREAAHEAASHPADGYSSASASDTTEIGGEASSPSSKDT